MDCTVNEVTPAGEPETRKVTIGGSMTIQHGEEIRTALIQALMAGKTLLLDLGQVTEIDISGFQLICAAHRASILHNKGLTVMREGNEAIDAMMRAVGYCRRSGCLEDTEHTCVWAGGGK